MANKPKQTRRRHTEPGKKSGTMKSTSHFKRTLLALAVFSLLPLVVQAQTPAPVQQAKRAATVPDVAKPDPLKLTEAELSELVAFANEQQSLSNQLQAKINAVLTVSCQQCDKAALITAAAIDAHNYFQQTVKPASEKADARMREIQKAHNCEGCAIKGGAFVKPEKAESAK